MKTTLPIKLKLLLSIFILFIGINFMNAQVTVQLLNIGQPEIKSSDLLNVQITNVGTAFTAKVVVSVNRNGLVYKATTSEVKFPNGTNQFSNVSFTLEQVVISNNKEYQILRSSGYFPAGEYEVCYKFFNSQTNEEFDYCTNFEVQFLSPILLLSPSNNEDVNNLYPILMWLPPGSNIGNSNIRYQVRLVEKLQNQTCFEAIRANLENFKGEFNENQMVYPMNSKPLENYKQYCWQVINPNDRSVDSEVWGFNVKVDSVLEEEKVIYNTNYIIPSTSSNLAIVNIKQELKVFFDSPEEISKFKMVISDLSGNTVFEGDQLNAFQQDNNKYSILLNQIPSLKEKHLYIILFSSPSIKKPLSIHFKYFN